MGDEVVSFGAVVEFETDLSADMLHGVIVGHDIGRDKAEFFSTADLDEAFERFGSKPALLSAVADQQGKFSVIGAVQFA